MPFDPLTGVFSPLHNWSEDRDFGLDILADRHTDNDADIADAINLMLRKDGANLPTQNLPMGGKRLTGLGAPVDPNDSVRKSYVDDALSPGVSNIGDYLTTERNPGSNWLRRDGAIYSKASYPALSTLLGARYAKLAGFSPIAFGSSLTIFDMAYGAGLFVAVGETGMIRTSPTGSTWTTRTSGLTENITRVAFANGQFVAVTGGGKILTSPDGITWTTRTSGVITSLFGIAYGAGKWVVCGSSGVILMSPDDGVNWVSKSIAGFTENLSGAAYGNGRFVLVGGSSVNGGGAATSTDGNTFNFTRSASSELTSVTFGKGVFVAVTGETACRSRTGVGAWTQNGMPSVGTRVVFGLNNFIAVGQSSGTTSSIDGLLWDTHNTVPASYSGGVAVGPSYALTGGFGGILAQSSYTLDIVTQFQVPADAGELGWIKAL